MNLINRITLKICYIFKYRLVYDRAQIVQSGRKQYGNNRKYQNPQDRTIGLSGSCPLTAQFTFQHALVNQKHKQYK